MKESLRVSLRKLFTNMWNLPNALTILRILLIPVFVILFFSGNTPEEIAVYRYWSLGVFLLASFTDMLDGKIARKYNLITDFGKLFDPLADKLMVCTALICQGVAGVFPWIAIIIVMAKELIMVLGGAAMLKRGVVVYSNLWGKAAQVCFIVALTLAFFGQVWESIGVRVDLIILWITVALALIAMVQYAASAIKQLKPDSSK